jgi:hypothetical protein
MDEQYVHLFFVLAEFFLLPQFSVFTVGFDNQLIDTVMHNRLTGCGFRCINSLSHAPRGLQLH